jgi:hypothetical protein
MVNHAIQRSRRALEKYAAIKMQIEGLSNLRKAVPLPPELDISAAQWKAIEQKLKTSEEKLLNLLNAGSRAIWSKNTKQGNSISHFFFADIQVQLPKAYAFFDTYLDVLSQRFMPDVGRLLGGCDVLAQDAIDRDHPALKIIVPPLVYLDRGFGASTIREGVKMPDKTPNPLPLIQIPYSKLYDKCNLTSILHEAGHEVMVRLGLKELLPVVVGKALAMAGAPKEIRNYFGLWMSEIGPDFWTFCNAGFAAAGGIREILGLPRSMVFHISWSDPHPPPYLRVLLNFEWCRQVWGKGMWDIWEREWEQYYPLEKTSTENREIFIKMKYYLPVVSRALLNTRFKTLNGQTITELFDMKSLAPAKIEAVVNQLKNGGLILKGLRPCAHLAVFRLIKEKGSLNGAQLDKLMSKWLIKLKNN